MEKDSDTQKAKEILGLTKESLMIWSGFAFCIAGFYILTRWNIFSLLLGNIVLLLGIILVAIGVIRDFRKKHLRIMHWIGNILVILFWLIFVFFFVMGNLSYFT